MILLEAGLSMDTTISLGDVITFGSILIGGIIGFFKYKADQDKKNSEFENHKKLNDKEIENLKNKLVETEKRFNEEIMNATNGRRAIRKEFKDELHKEIQVCHQRTDRLRDDNMKSYEKLENKIQEVENKVESSGHKIIEKMESLFRSFKGR